MNLNEEQLKAVEDLAYRLITLSLIAINIDVDETDFIHEVRTPGTMAREAFYKGYLRQMIETRDALIKSAKNGSNPAQLELLHFIKDLNSSLQYE